MDDPLVMDCREGIHDRFQELHGFLPGDLPALSLQVFFQADALDILHDKIGGPVLLKIADHPDDMGIAYKFGKGLCLFEKTLLTVFIV